MKRLRKVIVIISVVLGISSILLTFTGNNHLYKTVRHTILKGRWSPTIDDHKIFTNRVVESGVPDEWERSPDYNSAELTSEEEAYHEAQGTAAYVVIQDGKILFERYWNGYSDSSLTNGWSMTKSIVGYLIGVAIQDGLIPSEKQLISEYFPLYEGTGITIQHLLTMRAGIGFGESYINPFGYPARSLYTKNIKKVHEDYPAEGEPGKDFQYESGNSQLLAFIVEKVSGKTVSEYASEKLWKPIGAKHDAIWSLDKESGMEKAFCCFNSNALDFARLGQLYLNHGVWNGDTLIDPAYVQRATRPNEDLWPENNCSNCERYGYQWWVIDNDKHNLFYMRGFQGQYVAVMPDSRTIMVRLGHEEGEKVGDGHKDDFYEYIRQSKRIANIQ